MRRGWRQRRCVVSPFLEEELVLIVPPDNSELRLARKFFPMEDRIKPLNMIMRMKILNKLSAFENVGENAGKRIRLFISK